GESANSGQLAVLGKVPEQVGFLYGRSYLSIPFIFIPSAIWGSKPEAGGKLVAIHIYGNPLTGIPPGAVGEAYWNFSYLGIPIIFAIYGTILRISASIYLNNKGHPLFLLVFIYVLFTLQPTTPAIYGFAHAMVPVVIVWLIFRSRLLLLLCGQGGHLTRSAKLSQNSI